MRITFLDAGVPLTKTFSLTKEGSIEKEAYPLRKNFTSYTEDIKDTNELFQAIKKHAALGRCLLKGLIKRDLKNESRQGTTSTGDQTQWICLDFDRHEAVNIDKELAAIGLGDIQYILQYSSSQRMPGTEGTISAHVFMMLDHPMPAPSLKNWLMGINLSRYREQVKLSRDCNSLVWPLDISTCQNDKLIYIAPPKFKGMKDPMTEPRIQLVPGKQKTIERVKLKESHPEELKKAQLALLNDKRKAVGLDPRKSKVLSVKYGTYDLINNPTQAEATEVKDCGDYIRLNVNGGDSLAYYHPKGNFELIHDFKSGFSYKTKDFLPGYYTDCMNQQEAERNLPTENGEIILGLCDVLSTQYFKGTWHPKEDRLELYKARNETQVNDWLLAHGRMPGDHIEQWWLVYDPKRLFKVDMQAHEINRFEASEYMLTKPKARTLEDFPAITSIIRHVLGCTRKADDELFEHFINWFACIMQRKHKPLTAWVLHGTEGTGKGYFFNKIARPLLNAPNTLSIKPGDIEDKFNDWLENKLLIFVDEVEVDDFREKGRITATLRNYITEPTISIRRMQASLVQEQNWTSFIFSSNRPQPVFIPMGDRRYNVGNFQGKKMARPNDKVVEAELLKFAEYLLSHEADIEKANAICNTEAREHIKRLSLNSSEETANCILDGNLEELWLARVNDTLLNNQTVQNTQTAMNVQYSMLMKKIIARAKDQPNDRLTRDELLIIFTYNNSATPQSPNKFTSFLRHKGITTRRLRIDDELTYGIEVKWKISAEFRAEIVRELSNTLGKTGQLGKTIKTGTKTLKVVK